MNNVFMNCQDEAIKKINTALGKLDKPLGQGSSEQDHPWIVFSLGNAKYAINAEYVLRVAVLHELIPFVDTPAYCPGMMWAHDGMLLLLDLRALFEQGDYREAMTGEGDKLPVSIVIVLDGKKRGILVDEILMMEYFGGLLEDFTYENSARSRYILGAVRDKRFIGPVPVVGPDRFRDLEFEPPDARIDWNSRIDMRLLAKKMRENDLL